MKIVPTLFVLALSACLMTPGASPAREVRSGARTSVNQNANVNRNVNVNQNVNRNVNVNHHVDIDVDVDRNYHPWATAAAVVATAAVVGSIVRSVPPSCQTIVINGISYSQCGSTWYMPQMQGTAVTYVVVAPPR